MLERLSEVGPVLREESGRTRLSGLLTKCRICDDSKREFPSVCVRDMVDKRYRGNKEMERKKDSKMMAVLVEYELKGMAGQDVKSIA